MYVRQRECGARGRGAGGKRDPTVPRDTATGRAAALSPHRYLLAAVGAGGWPGRSRICQGPMQQCALPSSLVDSNADSNVEKSLWTLVDSSRENPLVCYTFLDTTGRTWTYHVAPGRFVSLAAGHQKSMPSIRSPGERNLVRMSPCRVF